MTLINIKLSKSLKEILKKSSEVEDIILFGSTARGKEKPADTDILIIFKHKVNKEIEYLIRKELEKQFKNLSIISKTNESIYNPSFDGREAILFEGISLITGRRYREKFGLSSFGMFRYHFSNWNKSTKTKFYYALNGRGNSIGILNKLEGIKLSDGILLVPLEKTEAMKEFFASWDLSYKYIPLLLPERLGKKNILEE